jgi:NitT/TauT family transport system substrate-binding protein
MSRKFLAAAYLVLTSTLLGCAAPVEPLRVGANIWPGYEPFFLARHQGYFDDTEIHLISFSSAVEVVRAYRNGLIDVAAVTGDEALAICETQPDQRVVLVCDFSNGADVLLAKPEFESIESLRGKRIGVETGALGAYVLAEALEKGGLRPEDVEVVPTPLLSHVSAFSAGKIDAVITFEPQRSTLMNAGARKIFDSSEIPYQIVDLLLTRRALAPEKQQQLALLVRGWFRALAYMQAQPDVAAAIMAVREDCPPEQFLASLKLIEFPSREDNLRLLGDSQDSLQANLQELAEEMLAHKFVSKPIPLPGLDTTFVEISER